METSGSLFINPTVIAAIIGAIAVICAPIIIYKIKKKEHDDDGPTFIVIPPNPKETNNAMQNSEGNSFSNPILPGIESLDDLSINDEKYLRDLATKGELFKRPNSTFEINITREEDND